MTVRNITNGIENGSKHVILIDNETGEVFLSTIWYNEIPEHFLDKDVIGYKESSMYELRLFVE